MDPVLHMYTFERPFSPAVLCPDKQTCLCFYHLKSHEAESQETGNGDLHSLSPLNTELHQTAQSSAGDQEPALSPPNNSQHYKVAKHTNPKKVKQTTSS